MPSTKKKIAAAATMVILIVAVYAYYQYQRRPADVTGIEPVVKVNATAIVEQYGDNEAKANTQYLGKIIQVSGLITELTNQQDTSANVVVGDANSLHKVSCLLDKRHISDIKNYSVGQPVTIKGICTGYLMDIELNRCVIVDKNSQ